MNVAGSIAGAVILAVGAIGIAPVATAEASVAAVVTCGTVNPVNATSVVTVKSLTEDLFGTKLELRAGYIGGQHYAWTRVTTRSPISQTFSEPLMQIRDRNGYCTKTAGSSTYSKYGFATATAPGNAFRACTDTGGTTDCTDYW